MIIVKEWCMGGTGWKVRNQMSVRKIKARNVRLMVSVLESIVVILTLDRISTRTNRTTTMINRITIIMRTNRIIIMRTNK